MSAVPPVVVAGCAVLSIAASPILLRLVEKLRIDPARSRPAASVGLIARLASWTPGVVVAVGIVVAGLVAPSGPTFALLVLGSALLVVVSLVDLAERRIPNRVTYPAIAVCLAVAAVAGSTGEGDVAASALVGGATFASVLFGLHWVRPDAMGLGDVKLVFPLGFAIGWVIGDAALAPAAVGATLAAASLVGLAAALGSHRGRPGAPLRGRPIPFGPPLSIAAAVAIVVSLNLS